MIKPSMKGVLKTWKEDRGFGFITPDNGGKDIFIHITAIGEAGRRPMPGDIIHYQIARDKHGKLRAINAYIEGVISRRDANGRQTKGASGLLKLVLVTVIALILAAAVVFWYLRQTGSNLGAF